MIASDCIRKPFSSGELILRGDVEISEGLGLLCQHKNKIMAFSSFFELVTPLYCLDPLISSNTATRS